MGFLTKEGLQNLTNKLVQGDAIKVASHRGKNVKEVIDNIQRECESVALPNTMTLENRVDKFKVGKGRDVDVSGDVEEGKINVELQGKTYQNLIKENQSYTKDLVTTNHTGFLFPKYDLKSNVTYTIMFNVSNLVKDGNDRVYCIFRGNNDSNVFIQFDAFYVEKNGLFAQKFTLANGLKNFLIGVSGSSNKNNPSFTIGDIMILEGDHTQTPIEELPKYFENIKSSFENGVVEVEVQGKNLISAEEGSTSVDTGTPAKVLASWTSFPFESGFYTFSVKGDTTQVVNDASIRILTYVGTSNTLGTYKRVDFVRESVSIAEATLYIEKGTKVTLDLARYNATSGTLSYSNIQFEKSPKQTSYEPYYKKKISFNIGEPLRSLPSGVCDEIRNSNGQWELVRRVGKTILDETYDYKLWGNTPSEGYFVCHADSYLQGNDFTFSENLKNTICDKLPVSTKTGQFKNVSFYRTNPHITVLSSEANSVSEFKTWIAKNPITLYYELVTPITTPIEPLEFNTSQGAVININSNISPASTHKVILNRAGQIEQGIELIANLKSRINELENIYDSNLIATQYRIDNLKLNYELEREED